MFGESTSLFASRCYIIKLETEGLAAPMAERVKAIAKTEKLDGRPIRDYVALVERHEYNMRQVLNEVEMGVMLK
jgi:hypothetical protein